MSKSQRAALAQQQAKSLSSSDVIRACIAAVCPTAWKEFQTSGRWGDPLQQTTPIDKVDRSDCKAPYVVLTLDDGSRRVRLITEDGDVVSGNGPTVAAAVAALAQKVLPQSTPQEA